MADPLQVITANRTDDGAVVYLVSRSLKAGWSEVLTSEAILQTEDEVKASLKWARDQEAIVTDPYVMRVVCDGGEPTPISAREKIRHAGVRSTLRRLGYDKKESASGGSVGTDEIRFRNEGESRVPVQ